MIKKLDPAKSKDNLLLIGSVFCLSGDVYWEISHKTEAFETYRGEFEMDLGNDSKIQLAAWDDVEEFGVFLSFHFSFISNYI